MAQEVPSRTTLPELKTLSQFGAPVQVQEERWKSGEGKMEKSFLTFAHVSSRDLICVLVTVS